MRSEQAQATVESVGIILAVALLVGAVAAVLTGGRLGTAVAQAVTRAFERALDYAAPGGSPAQPRATAAQLALFGQATDPSIAEDARPTLRDVRLRFEQDLGVEQGDALFRRLLLDEVVALRPGTREPERFAATFGAVISPETVFARPPPGGPFDTERPIGDTTMHVTTASEETAYLRLALHSHDVAGTALDLAGEIPIAVVQQFVSAAGAIRAVSQQLDDARARLLRTDGIAAGAREGDVIACWVVLRTRPSGTSGGGPDDEQSWNAQVHHYYHLAIVRDRTVVAEYLVPDPKRSTSCNLS